jgi:tRNA pseudouridine38/39 synthase
VIPRAESKVSKKPRNDRQFDPSKYSTRLIALKLAYLGKRYNGFEHHVGNKTPLPTIEEELWKALNKAKLIFPKTPEGGNPPAPGEVNWEGCDYSKCGRTDKGVSAFGQVIGIRVRSNRPLEKKEVPQDLDLNNNAPQPNAVEAASPSSQIAPSETAAPAKGAATNIEDEECEEPKEFDPINDELPYCALLNRLLPPDIRILAWCPSPPADFSARFSCRERRYRYFFTQPAFTPVPTPPSSLSQNGKLGDKKVMRDGWLDIEAMREAARMYEGLHDFRNFCKVDPSKQISNFDRRIFYANIEEVPASTSAPGYVNTASFLPEGASDAAAVAGAETGAPKVYTFTLHGSAFLWHQVRCMVAVLFLVGQGLEKPSIIAELLDAKTNPRRPMYEMAQDLPLVLWDCVFPSEGDSDGKDALQWHYVGDGGNLEAKFGTGALMEDLWRVWRERKIDEVLAGSLINLVAGQGEGVETGIAEYERNLAAGKGRKSTRSQKVFEGGHAPRLQGAYMDVMKKPRLETVEVINEKYAVRKGFESAADLKEQGFRRMNKKFEGDVAE